MVKISSVMKKVLTISVLAALALCSCQKEAMQQGGEANQAPRTITASIVDGATKTTLGTGGKVLWQAGDLVSVFAGSKANSKYQVSDGSAGSSSGTLEYVSTPSGDYDSMIYNAAYYPYSAAISFGVTGKGGTVTGYKFYDVYLPITQIYAENSFAGGAFPMVAVNKSTENTDFQFRNVLGGLKLQLKGTAKIKSVSISGNDNETLSGNATVFASDTPSVSMNSTADAFKTVTLDCGEGVQLSETEATSFIIALPPMTMSKGFTITVKDSEGKQMKLVSNREQTITRSALLEMPEVVFKDNTDYTKEPFTLTCTDGASYVEIKAVGSPDAIYLEYSTDGESWSTYILDATKVKLKSGGFIQFRARNSGNDTFSKDYSNYYHVEFSDGAPSVRVSGNIMSLLSRDLSATTMPEHAFDHLFDSCSAVTDASDLKLPDFVSASCYSRMFYNCTELTGAPALPATTLAEYCYSQMFRECKLLTTAPALPAMKLADCCYQSMFYNCSSLTTAPVLKADELVSNCYYEMFNGCTSLEIAPDLPATKLADCCYQSMFFNCSGLKTAPVLNASELKNGCYYDMFSGCTSLKAAPDLPATKLADYCYASMFSGCTSLTTAPVLNASELKEGCYYGMFSACTSLRTAPVLNASELKEGCYYEMFSGCTSLKTAPELPAKILVSCCYYQMFYGCSSLNYVKALFTTIPVDKDCLTDWLSGVSSEGTFVKSSAASWTKDDLGLPSGWTLK